MNSIDRLLEDIFVRHACKNISKYVADFEKAIDIKLVPADSSNLEFTWSKDFQWYSDAVDAREIIFDYFFKHKQQPKMFSVKDYKLSDNHRLSFTFKFHPENAV